jgi:hypothetical protein
MVNTIKNLFKDFFYFLLNPKQYNIQIQWKNKYIIPIITLLLMTAFIGIVFLILLPNFPFTNQHSPEVFDYQMIPDWLFGMVGVLIIPIFEELSFRLPLHITWKNVVISIISIFIIFLFLSRKAIATLYFEGNINWDNQYLFVPAFLITLVLLYSFLEKYFNKEIAFKFYFFPMVVLFAISHRILDINNLMDVFAALRSTVIQCFAGLLYGYLRLKFNLGVAISAHIFWNGMLSGLKMISGA